MDKGNDYSLIQELVKEKVKALFAWALITQKIHEAFKKHVQPIVDTASAEEAVARGFQAGYNWRCGVVKPGLCFVSILFKNYEDRGTQFKRREEFLSSIILLKHENHKSNDRET